MSEAYECDGCHELKRGSPRWTVHIGDHPSMAPTSIGAKSMQTCSEGCKAAALQNLVDDLIAEIKKGGEGA